MITLLAVASLYSLLGNFINDEGYSSHRTNVLDYLKKRKGKYDPLRVPLALRSDFDLHMAFPRE
jgi:hypothetical protein